MTQEDLEQIRALISAKNEVLFAAMRAIEDHIDHSIGELRDEFSKRLDLVERHLDRLDSRFSIFEFQMAGIGKTLAAGEKLNGELINTQVAQ